MGAAVLACASSLGAAAQERATAQAPQTPAAAPASEAPLAAPSTGAPSATPAAQAPAPTVAAEAQGGTIKGTVKAGPVPLPGVAVTATNTLTGKRYATTTDIDGNFQMTVPKNGRYVVKTELTGFATMTHEVVVNAASQNGGLPVETADFKMDLASRVAPEPSQAGTAAASQGAESAASAQPGTATSPVARVGRGTQALTVQGSEDSDLLDATAGEGNTGAQLPSLAGDDTSAAASDSIAVSGQQGQINGLAGFSQQDLQNRIQEMQRQGMSVGEIAGAFQGAMAGQGFGGPGGGFGGQGGGFGGPGGGFGGGFGGPGGGFRGGGGFGGFRGQNPNAWHGRIQYTGADNALNADSYSVTGTPIPKPAGDRNTLIASFTGTPFIPHLMAPNPKQFVFLSVQGTRNTSPTVSQVIVPTLAQRLGDLSPASQAQKIAAGQQYFDPATGLPYGPSSIANPCSSQLLALYSAGTAPTACIPASELSAPGIALLNYYPLPNITPTETGDNYQANIPGTSDSSQISARYNRSFGSTPLRGQGRQFRQENRNAPPSLRQSIAENFAYSHQASAAESFSPLLGGKSLTDGYSFSSTYTVGYGRLNNNFTVGWNRSRATASNYFTNAAQNPAVQDGVYVGNPTIYGNPFYFGVPAVSLTGLAGLSDTTPSNTINQTISFSEQARWNHKRHNMFYGIDFRRIHADSIGGSGGSATNTPSNPLGSFTFSGYSTENPAAQACNPNTDAQKCTEYGSSGSPVADILLGLPQQTAITAGLNKIYLRGNSWDWYVNDDWRIKSNVTFNYGLRWEYFSPYSEKYNRLVNLQLTGSGSNLDVQNVCPGSVTGCALTASQFGTPVSLVNPDKSLYSPRVAIAWAPKFKWTRNTVVRSGYGINYNTGAYATYARKLAFQQPFAVTQTNTLSTPTSPTTCTFANMSLNVLYQNSTGFNCSTQTTQSNYGVDPNYRLGMVQVYNLGIQHTLGQGVVLNIDYTGAYAGNLDMLRAPNRNATGVLNSSSGQFTYEDSLGYQRSNALLINARQRLHKGVSLQASYVYSHSIDDASSIGGSGGSIAQNDQDLAAEESNSTFDVRHKVTGSWIWEPPFGPNRALLNKGGFWSKFLDGYSVSGSYTFATGTFATPQYSGTPAEIAAGSGNSLRPDRNFAQEIHGPETHLEWFNTSAFVAPLVGTYGNASRNSIELPGMVSVNGALSRNISLGETRGLEMRISATNVFNTVQYSGVNTQINSTTFGQVTSAAGMRTLSYLLMYRF